MYHKVDNSVKKYLLRLNRFEVTTAYPLLLNCYDLYENGKLNNQEFKSVLTILENYLIRRFVCGIPTNQLTKIFSGIFSQLASKEHQDFVEQFKIGLQSKGYPKDTEFKIKFKEARLYGSGDRGIKTKLILEALEENYAHKEIVPFNDLTIEHIMPQTLTDSWKNHLGNNWEDIYDFYLHTVGNLTLTAYNSELSNDDFSTKCNTLKESHLEINRYFQNCLNWSKDEMLKRGEMLANIAVSIWSYFGNESTNSNDIGCDSNLMC